MATGNEARFRTGERVYYDDNPGRVIHSFKDGHVLKCEVDWGQGVRTTVWQSDLMSESEYHESLEW